MALLRLAAAGVVHGDRTGGVIPQGAITRGQLASMDVRTLAFVGVEPDRMVDVPGFDDLDGVVHAGTIPWLAAVGIVGGTGDGRYRPHAAVSRGQTASIVMRLMDVLVVEGVVDAEAVLSR